LQGLFSADKVKSPLPFADAVGVFYYGFLVAAALGLSGLSPSSQGSSLL